MPSTGRAGRSRVTAWRPGVGGVAEVLHARFFEHAYPMHTHDTWSLLIVDDGMVRYDLEHDEHGALHHQVTLLPPHIPHSGSPATPGGFRKRVLYLGADVLGEQHIGAAVDRPTLADPLLRHRVHQLHTALAEPGGELEAESRLAFVAERLVRHLDLRSAPRPGARPAPGGRDAAVLADRLRQLLDARVVEGLTLREAAARLHAHPTRLVRTFSRAFGIAPHQYLTARRVDRARRMLLDGMPPSTVAAAAGFYDQSHLTRHFKRIVGMAPGRYAAGAAVLSRPRPP
ncbi:MULTISPECIES: helix-turn-helix transcriptional regulator [Streptomyces]|uniref:helix-turn-helix transcriptional regulator n=1 Tax=Streptomyces TaxID=1883 RepID=UPI00163C8707|nr:MULTISPECIES: AraC family transcriptional regulator [Streptomyces]MBC2873869.1 AraC family transcriptional regulator [Streptomyces sp. TYQ1024]UBI39185.1 AraC family transcriptional regulator [Streptomyces mobaraensis]UKW31767.1 AraC family transcriptional regulator [Streptomyces sp. TYQ1024]